MSDPDSELRFPDIVPTSFKKTRVWIYENNDFRTEEDISILLGRMYEYPEDDFFLFTPKNGQISSLIDSAIEAIILVSVEMKGHYYHHPKFIRDYVFIHELTAAWDWEREVLSQGNMYFRHELKLSERARRELEMQQLIAMQKKTDLNPFRLVPSFMGVGIDLKKMLPWLKQKLKK
jgi:hypothetical protein